VSLELLLSFPSISTPEALPGDRPGGQEVENGGEDMSFVSQEMTLRGFMVSLHCPSEELLTVTINCSELPPTTYLQLVQQLQDLLSEIDERYAAKELQGRSLRARYRRVSVDQRLRLLKFSPFPSRILNKIKYVRAKAYDLLHDYCLVIRSVESLYYRDNVYILPEERAEEFANAVDRLDRELDEARQIIVEHDLGEVELLISRYGLELPRRDFMIPPIRIDMFPVDLSYAIEEWAFKSSRVQQLLAQKQEELVRGAVEAVREKLEPILKAMEGEMKIAKLEERLQEIKRLAEGLGLKALAETVIEPLIVATKDPTVLRGERPTTFVRGRIASLFA
jgi:hypothetical protein